jgi:hypothetical protein
MIRLTSVGRNPRITRPIATRQDLSPLSHQFAQAQLQVLAGYPLSIDREVM